MINDLEIYYKGLQNENYYDGLYGGFKKRKISLVIYILAGIVLAKRKDVTKGDVAWVNGRRGYEKNYENGKCRVIHHGTFFSNPCRLRKEESVFSYFSRGDSFKKVVRAILAYKKSGIKNLPYWLEFVFISDAMYMMLPSRVFTPHISDRHATWISYIVRKYNGKLIIHQHGVCTNNPNKIFCNQFYALSQEQCEYCKSNLIKNDDCAFSISTINSVVKFHKMEKAEGTLVGIASQCNADFVFGIVEAIRRNGCEDLKNAKIVIMLHPLEKAKHYKSLKDGNIVIESRRKYINIDILITANSTIIYDYYYSRFNGIIAKIDKDNSIEFKDVPNVTRFINIKEAVQYMNDYIQCTCCEG
jgi:hypothetical protein